mmetsp:Transcript_53/g.183  ORF Transcript_53/g.183 Transcript_53/m.183 type:complete len:313 (+) Transcript_53:537-1475(+)
MTLHARSGRPSRSEGAAAQGPSGAGRREHDAAIPRVNHHRRRFGGRATLVQQHDRFRQQSVRVSDIVRRLPHQPCSLPPRALRCARLGREERRQMTHRPCNAQTCNCRYDTLAFAGGVAFFLLHRKPCGSICQLPRALSSSPRPRNHTVRNDEACPPAKGVASVATPRNTKTSQHTRGAFGATSGRRTTADRRSPSANHQTFAPTVVRCVVNRPELPCTHPGAHLLPVVALRPHAASAVFPTMFSTTNAKIHWIHWIHWSPCPGATPKAKSVRNADDSAHETLHELGPKLSSPHAHTHTRTGASSATNAAAF